MICSLLTAASIFTGLCSDAVPQTLANRPPSFNAGLARNLINRHRVSNGLSPLSINNSLMALVYNPKAGKQTYWTLVIGVPR